MSCNRCYLLLKDLDLKCFTQNQKCTESELRTDLKKANLLIHPDKNSDPDSHEKFIKYSKCIKFLLENYSCYNDKFSHCNSVTHSFTKGFSTKPKCIKFRKRTSKSTGDCPSGYFIRKGYTRPAKCKFPHKSFKILPNESITSAIERLVNDPIVNRFYYKLYHSQLKYNVSSQGEYRISKHETDTVKYFKPLYRCKDFFELKYPTRNVVVREDIFAANIQKQEYHRLHPELSLDTINKHHFMMSYRIPKNPKFYTDKKVFIKHVEKHKHFLYSVICRTDNDKIKMPENKDFLYIPYALACLMYSFGTIGTFLYNVRTNPEAHIVDGDKIYYKCTNPRYANNEPHKLLVKISVKEYVDLNWDEIKKDLYDETINDYYYSNEYFEKYMQDFSKPPPKQGYTFSML